MTDAALTQPVAHAYTTPPPAYQLAAQQAGVPVTMLYAIALQESGMNHQGRRVPWPWSLNVAGQTLRFPNRAAACTGLKQALQQVKPTQVDAGLAQINVGYQQHRYQDPCELLNPYRNLRIATQILLEQHQPGQDWLTTAGRYHRPAGGEPAARYRAGVSQQLQRLQTAVSSPTSNQPPAQTASRPATQSKPAHQPAAQPAPRLTTQATPTPATAAPALTPKTTDTKTHTLIIIEDQGNTVSALPYYQALNLQPRPGQTTAMPPIHIPANPHTQPTQDTDFLPLTSNHLSPGKVTPRTLDAPGLTPLFLIGDDPQSKSWLKNRLSELQALNAIGLVVQAATPQALTTLRKLAPGLTLSPASADDLAQRLGLRHYPVLITSTGIDQ